MSVGNKIKEYRTKKGLTQKQLADKLYVTYQAVSRWEKDEVEPSVDTLKKMSQIFKCSVDDLFEIETKKEKQKKPEKVKVKVVEKIVEKSLPQVLTICGNCNKPIYNQEDIHRISTSHSVRHGRRRHTEHGEKILCNECFKEHEAEEKRIREQRRRETIAEFRSRRIHSFIWPTIAAAIFIFFGIKNLGVAETHDKGIKLIVYGLLCFTFLSCCILNNTFIPRMWLAVASFGFVKMPGVIFSFDLDGLIFLIGVKIALFLLGIAIAVAFILLATALGFLLSPFAYPFALSRNVQCDIGSQN